MFLALHYCVKPQRDALSLLCLDQDPEAAVPLLPFASFQTQPLRCRFKSKLLQSATRETPCPRLKWIAQLGHHPIRGHGKVHKLFSCYSRARGRRVGLTFLETGPLPPTRLSDCLSNLSHLTTLHVQDSSALTREIACAILKHCPALSEVGCFSCKGKEIDGQIAVFLTNLEPHSLRR